MKHVKHENSLDVQIRTKILDEYGNPIIGAIEYDPSTGFGKRIKDPTLGLVEDFYYKNGSIELDGHNFDDTNSHDQNKLDSIKEMIDLRVSRDTPEYEDMLKAKISQKHDEAIEKQKRSLEANKVIDLNAPLTPESKTFIAITQIAKDEEVIIDLDKGEIRGTRSDNTLRPTSEIRNKRHGIIGRTNLKE